MNPDHADESDQRNEMPREVEDALRKHGAINDALCINVAAEVYESMRAAYDDLYRMWQETFRDAGQLERERDRLRAALEEAMDLMIRHDFGTLCTVPMMRAALEGKP